MSEKKNPKLHIKALGTHKLHHEIVIVRLLQYSGLNLSWAYEMSLCMTKPTIWVSDQVQHKPACTVTEETQNLENLGISRGGNVLSV